MLSIDDESRHRPAAPTDAVALAAAYDQALAEIERLQDKAEHLASAMESNRRIGMALGILMAVHHLTPEAAFDWLRQVSQRSDRKVRDLAEDIILIGTVPEDAERPRPRRARQP